MIAPKLDAIPPPHILVVDDDAPVRHVLAEMLRRLGGYAVRTAADGASALEQLDASGDVDLIVSDLAMPGMGGLDLLAALPRNPVTGGTRPPLAIVSGHVDRRRREQCLDAGAAAVMAKPVNPDALLDMVRQVLDRRASSPG